MSPIESHGATPGWKQRLLGKPVELLQPNPLTRRQWWAWAGIMVVAVLARFVMLGQIPPGLWYDEALYALDGYSVSQGHWAWFFAEGGHPREPLFPWLLGLAFMATEPSVLVARCVSAAAGCLAVAMFFPVARRLMSNQWALAAMAAFAVFRWHVHFSRTIFRAGLASAIMLLIVWAFLRWRERRHPIDAALCGIALGVGLYTYISLRIAPLLVTAWIVWLAWQGQFCFRKEWRQVAALYAALAITVTPLAIDYARHPDHLNGRTDEISLFDSTISNGSPAMAIAKNAIQVAGAWFVKGDHVAKHNIPFRPVFDPVTGLCFSAGLLLAIWQIMRHRSLTAGILITWFGGFAMASVLSFGAPNILRMQGASPVVVLIMVFGLQKLICAWPKEKASGLRLAVPGIVLIFFAATQLYDYFVVFPRDLRVRQEFTADIYYEPSRAADILARQVNRVYMPAEMMDSLQVRFTTIREDNFTSYSASQHLPAPFAGEKFGYLLTERSKALATEHGIDLHQEVRAMPHARLESRFSIPVPDDDGKLIRRESWAELWTTDRSAE